MREAEKVTPRLDARVPAYPRLSGVGLAMMVGMGAAVSCGGADGGFIRRPSGTQFTQDEAGGSSATRAGAAGNAGIAGAAGDAGHAGTSSDAASAGTAGAVPATDHAGAAGTNGA